MDKIFNGISIVFGALGGILSFCFGGFDTLLIALIVLVVIDYITGFLKGAITTGLSSTIGFKGLFKKVLIFCIVALGVVVSHIVNDSIPIREVVIMFYIVNEGLSILENCGEFLPIPQKLKDILIQIRDKHSKDDDDSEDKGDISKT